MKLVHSKQAVRRLLVPTRPGLRTGEIASLIEFSAVREAGPYLFLRAGRSHLALVARTNVTPPATTICAFEVADSKATLAALRARSVVFEEYDTPTLRTVDGMAKVGPFHAAWMRDPDGNLVGIQHRPTNDEGP